MDNDQRRSAVLAQRAALGASVTGVIAVFALATERAGLVALGLVAAAILLAISTLAGRKAWGRDMRLGWIGILAIVVLLGIILVMNAFGRGLENMRF